MTRLFVLAVTLAIMLLRLLAIGAQDSRPAPTLVQPTLVATAASTALPPSLAARSAVSDIIERGRFRVGVLYNDPPYSVLSQTGHPRGFDIGLLNALAELWEVDLELVQVTRQNALQRLDDRSVDALASALVHYRGLEAQVEFSQTYYWGRQALMTRAESGHDSARSLIDAPIGYVIGDRTESALAIWQGRLGAQLDLRGYFTLDQAFSALLQGEIESLAGEEQALRRVSGAFADLAQILDEPLLIEPHALAFRRRDANLRGLINRSLQHLAGAGQLEDLVREHFPGVEAQTERVVTWAGSGEAPKPADFAGEITSPAQDTIDRVLGAGIFRVGGFGAAADSASPGERRLSQLHRDLVDEIARRWNVTLERVPGDAMAAMAQLAAGGVDAVVGVAPDWRWAGRADFTMPYLLHGDRMMLPANSRIRGFNDLRGGWIGLMNGDDGARERAQTWADSVNASVRFYQTRPADAALTILELENADVIYADSLALLPHLETHPNALRLTDRWYSRSYFALALQHNDPDFRALLDYTIQELIIDGALERMSAPLLMSGTLPEFDIVPGPASYAGINLSAS